jgi:hypothetical protein
LSFALALLLVACPRSNPPTPNLVESADAETRAKLAGTMENGTWQDARFPWTIRAPSGWEALPGVEGLNPRLTLIHTETRARLEVSVREDGVLGPVARRGCTWAFESEGGYRALPGIRPLVAATCTPEDRQHARVLGYFLVSGGLAWDVELVAPPGALIDAKRQSELVLSTFRLRGPGAGG